MELDQETSLMLKVLLINSLFLLLLSCSTTKIEQQQNKKTADIEKNESKSSLKEASAKLKELVKSAKKAGDGSVRFLASDMFLKANSAQLRGDYVTANFIYSHLLELNPHDRFLRKKYAVSLIKAGDLPTSEQIMSGLYEEKKEDEKIALILAGIKSGLGKVEQAKQIYQSILKLNPKSEDGCLFLGKIYSIEGKTQEAMKTFKRCEKKASAESRSLFTYQRGRIYLEKGELDEAQVLFKKAYQLDNENSEAALAIGLIYEESNQLKKALSHYKKHIKKFPGDVIVLTRTVTLLFAEEKFDDVLEYAEKLVDLEPDNLNLKVKMGVIYSDQKNYPKAISLFKDVLQYAPKSDRILYYLAAIYQEMRDYENAIEFFNQVDSQSPLFSDSILQIANIMSTFALGTQGEDSQKAKEQFFSFIEKNRSKNETLNVELAMAKANFLEKEGNFEFAISTLLPLKQNEDFVSNHKYYLASLYEKIGNYQESESLILDVIEEDPDNAHAWNFLGYSYLERGVQLEKAYQYISKAVSLNPDDGYIRDSLGWYHFKQGEMEKALKELKMANKSNPGDSIITKHLAQVYHAMKRFKEAKLYYLQALKVSKEEVEKKEIQSLIQHVEKKRMPANLNH